MQAWPDALETMVTLGRAGFVVSVACGPCGVEAFAWTVQVLALDGESTFQRPYKAHSFTQAIEIAQREISRRGWDTMTTS